MLRSRALRLAVTDRGSAVSEPKTRRPGKNLTLVIKILINRSETRESPVCREAEGDLFLNLLVSESAVDAAAGYTRWVTPRRSARQSVFEIVRCNTQYDRSGNWKLWSRSCRVKRGWIYQDMFLDIGDTLLAPRAQLRFDSFYDSLNIRSKIIVKKSNSCFAVLIALFIFFLELRSTN